MVSVYVEAKVRRAIAGASIVACLAFPGSIASLPAADQAGAPAAATDAQQGNAETVYPRAVVAADHPLASRCGADILRRGGNVVDAAVATGFALSVVRPASSGIGGGGFMVIWNADQRQATTIDYRERAPQAATRAMFADPKKPDHARDDLSRHGHLAIAVPMHVAGLCYALDHYGTLDLKTVLAPAIQLARDGIPVDQHQVDVQQEVLEMFRKQNGAQDRFAALHAVYLNGGEAWKPRDVFRSPLANVLEKIAEQGRAGFYDGEVAEAIVAEIRRGGGIITREDLAAAQPMVRPALRAGFDDMEIIAMPPPSSGGVALIESLNFLQAVERTQPELRPEKLGRESGACVHLLAEALQHSFADRARYLGDTDFTPVPVARLTSPEYAAQLATRFDPAKTRPSREYGNHGMEDDGGTSHYCVIDHRGNAVACTETINLLYGSWVVEPKFGIVLNDEMDDFAALPGRPNAFGLIQGEANAVGPGRRPLSSMCPTIVVRDGKAVHALGASGGPRIISTTLSVLLDLTRFGMSPADAVAAPRMHHQWMPAELVLEKPLFDSLGASLKERGHAVVRDDDFSVSQAASRSDAGLRGGSDPRKGGRPDGL